MAEQPSTQVVNDTVALAIRSDGVGPVLPLATPEAMVEAMRTYAALKAAVLTESDEQEITIKGKKRKFVKRSGWRRLSIAFGVSTTILDRKITTGPEGRTLSAEFTVRAVAPNGRFADGWGACSAWEERFQDERGRGKMEHDIPATAETRAENRACSNLFGYGEVSAEEAEDSPGVARPICPNCGKPVRQSTFNENEWFCWTKQGGCGWKGSAPVLNDTGEIAPDKASAATQSALREAERMAIPQSPSAQVNSAGAAVGPTQAAPAPVASGPRAKRGHVVPAPTAPAAPQGAPSSDQRSEPPGVGSDSPPFPAAIQGPAATAAVTSTPPVALLDPEEDDPGREQYLASLRQQAREAAAVLRQLRVRSDNQKHKDAIALGTVVALAVPPATPGPDSDASLAAYIAEKHQGKTLTSLEEPELKAVVDKLEELTALVSAKLQ